MSTPTFNLYIAPNGNDRWSGRLPEPNAEGTDGPLATLARARDRIRELKRTAALPGPATVWIRGGRYPLAAPVAFGPEDTAPVTYAAYPGEQPVFDGGRRIAGWSIAPHAEGKQAPSASSVQVWVADLPEVAAGKWAFRSLFVNGQRRPRARWPKVGPEPERRTFLWMDDVPGFTTDAQLFDGTDTFVCKPGDIRNWAHLEDVEVVVLHYWIEERMPIASFDEATRAVKSSRRSVFALKDDFNKRWAKYYVDNVFEALSEPGEWYLDRAAGKLYYLPMPGETLENTEVVAPCIEQFVLLNGDPDAGRNVEFLRFEGLAFEYADWHNPHGGFDVDTGSPPGIDYASSPQAASRVPAAFSLRGARHCAIEACAIRHAGLYAVELADGCVGNRVVGNDMFDLGAGGVKISGADAHGPAARRTGNNKVTDNHIHTCGRVFHSAVGVLSRHSFGNDISHNHIHDLFYSGVSCGWVWGYGDSVSANNRIEKNHIHDLGHGWLSDMGGIYTLSVQPGTVLRGNLIHDVVRANYGGWAIYPDEGSSYLVIENNVCYNTNSQPFHQHYGHENIVRNNIFAFGGEAQVAVSRVDDCVAITFERNIVLTDGQPIFVGGYGHKFDQRKLISDLNVFWDVSGRPPLLSKDHDLDAWRALGYDCHSVVADPKCRDFASRDFALEPDSPAFALGFQAIDLADVGPRPKGDGRRD